MFRNETGGGIEMKQIEEKIRPILPILSIYRGRKMVRPVSTILSAISAAANVLDGNLCGLARNMLMGDTFYRLIKQRFGHLPIQIRAE